MTSFSAQVDAWVSKTQKRVDAVAKTAAQKVSEGVKKPVAQGGNMRVKTGFLRASLMASTAEMPRIDRDANPTDGQSYSGDDSQINLVIAGWDVDKPLFLGFTASYAAPREYHDGFVRLEAQNWNQTVNESAMEIKAKVLS